MLALRASTVNREPTLSLENLARSKAKRRVSLSLQTSNEFRPVAFHSPARSLNHSTRLICENSACAAREPCTTS